MINENKKSKEAGFITVNGVVYAVGLMWDPVDNPDNAMKEAYAVAKSEDVKADFICLRNSSIPPQYGLGWKFVGHVAGYKPLAVAVIDNVGKDYIGAFKVNNKWWLGVSKNNIILPYGDAFYQTEDEIKEAVKKLIPELGENVTKFVPDEWGIEGSDNTTLDKLIKVPPTIKLLPTDSLVSRYKNYIMLGLIILIGGGMLLNSSITKLKEARQLKLARTAEIQKALANVDPWKNSPSVTDFFDYCQSAINSLPLEISGWDITEVGCDGAQITANMTKSGGFIYDIENKAAETGFDLLLNGDGTEAILSKGLSKIPPRSGDVDGNNLLPGAKIAQQFLDLQTKVGVEVSLSGVSRAPATPRYLTDADGNRVEIPPVYNSIKFSFDTDYPINSWKNYLKDFPALSMENITLKIGSVLEWSISGNIYQK